ncbi:DNA cytosine methyltransferase [Burkholderia sp. F1]|uniref:DNA cytosine methyltransferase n=1 Tax=Burkholderia sp. F1 TaxID=3366817 RepID=UPI003D750988
MTQLALHNTPPALRYGSVCSGIEAVSLAWQPLGMQPAWFAEIEPFPSAVLAHHHPDVPNLGDMTGIAAKIRCGTVEAPDILVGGTPCQSFSIAGTRQGMADPRGALTLSYVELANAIDQIRLEHRRPSSVLVWENVPGVLSDRANAFGCLLGALAGEKHALQPSGSRWTHAGAVYGPQRVIAWRVLDAQYFGVAQRRKRVFVVASARDDLDPSSVLFESAGLRGDLAQGCAPWQIAACTAASGTVWPSGYAGVNPGYGKVTLSFGGGNTHGPLDQAACLTARGHKCDFEVETFIAQSVIGPISHTLGAANNGKGCSEDGTGRGVPIVGTTHAANTSVAWAQNTRGEVRLESGHGQLTGTLMSSGKAGYGIPSVASVAIRGRTHGATAELGGDLSPTLRASSGGGDKGHVVTPNVEAHFQYTPAPPREDGQPDWSTWRVRRLMPVECERLQGMPDDWTLVPYRGKPAADAPRYKAIGNAMAVPCVAWIGHRLQRVLQMRGSAGDDPATGMLLPPPGSFWHSAPCGDFLRHSTSATQSGDIDSRFVADATKARADAIASCCRRCRPRASSQGLQAAAGIPVRPTCPRRIESADKRPRDADAESFTARGSCHPAGAWSHRRLTKEPCHVPTRPFRPPGPDPHRKAAASRGTAQRGRSLHRHARQRRSRVSGIA